MISSYCGSRRVFRLLAFALALAALGFLAEPATAQVLYGSIVGTVTDQTGAVVPRATVSVTNEQTGLRRESVTDDQGRYTFQNLPEGRYSVSLAAPGFKPFTQTGVSVTINTVTRSDISIELGAVTEAVTVSGTMTVLQTDKSDVHTELGTTAVSNLPLNQYRNYQALYNLVPGATPTQFQNSPTDTPQRSLTTNINGTARNNNNTRLDGASDVFIWLPHHAVYVPSADSVETVNVTTNAMDAEQGMAGGAAVTVATKSGTNDLHGSAYWFHQNQHFFARNFFLPADQSIPRTTFNITGASLGGPIKKNKLFFFGDWDGQRQSNGASGFFTVPTADQRAGNFSAYSTPIYDPLTGNPDGTARTQFPGNIIPQNRLSQQALAVQALIPLSNQPGTAGNFFASGTPTFIRDQWDLKINWNRTDNHVIWGRYSAMHAKVSAKFAFGAAGGPGVGGDPGTGDTLVQVPTVGHTWTITPHVLLDGTVGFTRMGQSVIGTDFGKNYGLDVFGIPGTNGQGVYGINYSGLPAFYASGYDGFGQLQTWMPVWRRDQSYTTSHNLTWTRGAHELRFGFDMVRHQLNHWQPEIANPRGEFDFGGGVTALKGGAAPNQFNGYAQFLLGLPDTMTKSLQYIYMTGREWQFGWYARDRWQATRNLTLNLGLRYEFYPLMTRAHSGIERLDPTTMLVYLGGRGNVPQDAGLTVSHKFFDPRIGLAYRLGANTVIRSGYGITTDPMPFSRPLRGWYPLTVADSFVGANTYVPYASLAQGIPLVAGPDLSTGVVPLPPTVQERSPLGGEIHRGYIQSWNFIIERRMPGNIDTSIGYVGTQTVHQLADLNINAAGPGQGNTGRPEYAQFGRTADTLMWDGYLSSHYHSLQVAVNRAMASGLFLKGAYTFSKAINYTDDDGWAGVSYNWLPAFQRNRAPAGYDRTHIFQMAVIYDLPFGKGKQHLSGGGPVAYILGNWQANAMISAYSGTPFSVTSSGASLNAPGGNLQTADLVAPYRVIGTVGPGQPWFDPAAFAPVKDVRFGTTGRNAFRGPGLFNADASLFREFPFRERFRLEFRAEAFNVLNHPHFNNPHNSATGGNFGVINSSFGERNLRLGLRFAF